MEVVVEVEVMACKYVYILSPDLEVRSSYTGLPFFFRQEIEGGGKDAFLGI